MPFAQTVYTHGQINSYTALFECYRSRFPTLYDAWELVHDASKRAHSGHGKDHDAAVAMMTQRIAPDERTAEMAWVAGLLHSIDHLVGKESYEETLDSLLTQVYMDFDPPEIAEIRDAVLKHNGRNEPSDSLTLVTLRDADRLINIQPLVIIRSGQFHPSIAAIELEHIGKNPGGRLNPESTYHDPKSVRDALVSCLEWESDPNFCLRLPAAIEIGKRDFQYLREFLARCEEPFHNLGLAGVRL